MDWSSSQPIRVSQDSALGSCKNSLPYPSSQSSGLSQVNTQDVFSQSQSEANKPSNMYEKWKSRQAMMKRDSVVPQVGGMAGSAINTPFPGSARWDSKSSINGFCPGSSQHRAKPVDYDDRKLMDQTMSIIRDCNNEVKASLFQLMEQLDKKVNISNEELAKSLSSFLETIWNHEIAVKKLIQEQGTAKFDLNELEVKLSKKEGQLSSLESQLAEAKRDQSERYAEVIKAEMESFQSSFTRKLEKLETSVKRDEKQQNEFMTDCFNSIHAQQKQKDDTFNKLKTGMKESEKRICSDMARLVQKMESKTLAQQKDSTKRVETVIQNQEKVIQEIVSSDCAQKQDLDDWALKLERTIQERLTDVLHSMEQIIKKVIKDNQKPDPSKTKGQVKSIGTVTEEAVVFQRSNHYVHQTRSDKRESDRLSHTAVHDSYHLSDNSHVSMNNKECGRASSAQALRYRPQLPDENTRPHSRCSESASFGQTHKDNAGRRDLERVNTVSNFQQNELSQSVDPIARNHYPEARASLQDSVPFRMPPFVSPFRRAESGLSPRKGPSPYAVVAPQRQAFPDQAYLHQDSRAKGHAETHQDGTKTKSKRRKKCVYSTKKRTRNKRKCVIDGLTNYNELALQDESEKFQRTPAYLNQCKSSPYHQNQAISAGNSNLASQLSKGLLQGRINRSAVREAFDPYKFEEPATPARPGNRGCEQDGFLRPQTQSRCGSVAFKRPKLTSTPKAFQRDASPQSSPSVSVLNMSIQRRVTTPYKEFNCRFGPQGSSSYRFSNRNWRREIEVSTPKTLLDL